MRKPPQALKSPIIAFVVRGRMKHKEEEENDKLWNGNHGDDVA